MACTERHKVLFGTHMFSEKAEKWWDNARQRLEVVGFEITWVVFRVQFLKNYFPEVGVARRNLNFLSSNKKYDGC